MPKIIGNCAICGTTEELMRVIKIKDYMNAIQRGKIDNDDIESTTEYCNTHFLEYVWYKNGREGPQETI